jgi:hypothetical protein
VSYTSAASHTSGTLMVTSGGVSATVTLVGNYSPANFSSSTVGPHVRITDPEVINGGGVEPGVPDIGFGAQTTLAYSENSTPPTVGLTAGRYAAALALLGNYMAGSFVTAADGHGGTLVSQAPQGEQSSRRMSNALAPPPITGGTELVGNITVKTGRCLSSVTFTVHRRKSGERSAKRENIVTRFAKSTALKCASARSLTSLPMLSGKSSSGADR